MTDLFSDNEAAALRPTENPGRTVAVIGTAGRDKDRPMTRALWEAMLADARSRVRPSDTLVSGGAAWADHLAVCLYLQNEVEHLVLHLPAPLEHGRFAGSARVSAGSAANFYHDLFKRNAGVDGLAEIQQAIERGAEITTQRVAVGYAAMHARNALVAKSANAVIAYTFGDGDVPADGGTRNTWDRAVHAERVHVPLARLLAVNTEPVPIFVFGSNLAGRHGKGAALYAVQHRGAVHGYGIGLQGQSYAIPTKDRYLKPLPLREIERHVEIFLTFAAARPDLTFQVTPIGCGLAGYHPEDIAPMFVHTTSNVLLPPEFQR